MNRWNVRKIYILIALFLSVGCTDVNPTVTMLKSIDDGFAFNASQITTASLFSVPLQASCSSLIQTVEMSFDGSTWMPLSTYDAVAKSTCENGAVSITLSNTKTPWKNMTFVNGQIITVKFRALPRIGPYIYRDVEIKYVPSSPVSQEILAGAQIQTGNGLKLRGKVRAQNQHVASGGSGAVYIRGRIIQ